MREGGRIENGKESLIKREEVREIQQKWANYILEIGKAYREKRDYKSLAEQFLSELYAYDEDGFVLFKPTLASQKQFRLTKEEALSYFIGGSIPEDKGFALNFWTDIRFEEAGLIIHGDVAISMGNYYFTKDEGGEEIKVEYTFGYKKTKEGKLLIILHHSSLPYKS